jgi:hypothetical protein
MPDAERAYPLGYIHTRRCAQCWGRVVEKHIDGRWRIVCLKDCQPGGHVSEDYVEYMLRKDASDYMEVAHNYPELAPRAMSREESDKARDALWPEQEDPCPSKD